MAGLIRRLQKSERVGYVGSGPGRMRKHGVRRKKPLFRYLLRRPGSFLVLVALLVGVSPSSAHHPGANIDKVMGDKEKFFQQIDTQAPVFKLQNTDGRVVTSTGLSDKIVVLNFIYTKCPDICPLHAEHLSKIQSMINRTPMKDMVRFITVTTDPVNDTLETLKSYGPAHGLDPVNWSFLTTTAGQQEDTTRKLAAAFGHKFIKTGDSFQVHSVVTHIIDKNGRWAANFHGLRFQPVNMVLYVNGLINNAAGPTEKEPPSMWKRIIEGVF
tara:strand:- start:2469 stop:3278 length:810 start_codon:yes stop_codon:yes gene_type:complete